MGYPHGGPEGPKSNTPHEPPVISGVRTAAEWIQNDVTQPTSKALGGEIW